MLPIEEHVTIVVLALLGVSLGAATIANFCSYFLLLLNDQQKDQDIGHKTRPVQ